MYFCENTHQLYNYVLKISGGPKSNKTENYDETENKPEVEYEKKPPKSSWKNSKYEKPNSQNNKDQHQPKEPPSAEKEDSKVYSTREFRRSNR